MRTPSAVLLTLAIAASACAQNKVPRPARPVASKAAGTANGGTNAATDNATAQPSNSTGITGTPRYRAGFRGRPGTAAPATPGEISRVGEDGTINPGDALLPVAKFRNNAFGIPPGTPVTVRLAQTVDSGHVKNGETIPATLEAPVAGLPKGTKVELTVVSSAAAGQMTSAGELSVQIVRLDGKPMLSQVITAEGKEGTKLTEDGAPQRGTEAQLSPDQPLVLPAA